MASKKLSDADVAARSIRTSDVIPAFDPADTDASTSARTDTLAEVIRTVITNLPGDLTDGQKTAVRDAISAAAEVTPFDWDAAYGALQEAPQDLVPGDSVSAYDGSASKIYKLDAWALNEWLWKTGVTASAATDFDSISQDGIHVLNVNDTPHQTDLLVIRSA